MNKLFVSEHLFHWRKANYWDMPKCATCEHRYEKPNRQPYEPLECLHSDNKQFAFLHMKPMAITDAFGCVHHSDIEQPKDLSPSQEND